MADSSYDHGYGVDWKDLFIQYRKGYFTSVSDFHRHDFYEINLILSGNIKILLADKTEQGTQNRIVLTRPGTPHYISCNSDTLYNRLYLMFSEEFIADYIPQWQKLVSVFGTTGRIITITEAQTAFCKELIDRLQTETDKIRQRLMILYLLSYLGEFAQEDATKAAPHYIMKALTYMEEHYREKIIASDLAKKLYVSRTTLMTDFKKHTGTTLNHYLVNCRLKQAIKLLRQGKPEYEAAVECGFCDSCALIRSFKKHFGLTPRQYLQQTIPSKIH